MPGWERVLNEKKLLCYSKLELLANTEAKAGPVGSYEIPGGNTTLHEIWCTINQEG